MKKSIKSALIQHPPVYMNLEASVDKAVSLINEAVTRNAELIVFPETWLPGYPVWLDHAPKAASWGHEPNSILYRILTENSVELGDKHLKRLQTLAQEKEITIIMGAHERSGRSLFNTLFYFSAQGDISFHRKVMPTYSERLIWAQGDGSTFTVIEQSGIRIGGLICWEHWMPLTRSHMHSKNEHIHVAQWPMVKELHQLCSRNYAFEGQCFVIASGCILSKNEMIEGLRSSINDPEDREALTILESIPAESGELLLKGGSSVINPDSSYLLEPQYNVREIFIIELNLNKTIEGNLYLDTSGHYSRPDIFTLNVNEEPQHNSNPTNKQP